MISDLIDEVVEEGIEKKAHYNVLKRKVNCT